MAVGADVESARRRTRVPRDAWASEEDALDVIARELGLRARDRVGGDDKIATLDGVVDDARDDVVVRGGHAGGRAGGRASVCGTGARFREDNCLFKQTRDGKRRTLAGCARLDLLHRKSLGKVKIGCYELRERLSRAESVVAGLFDALGRTLPSPR